MAIKSIVGERIKHKFKLTKEILSSGKNKVKQSKGVKINQKLQPGLVIQPKDDKIVPIWPHRLAV